MFLGLLVLPGSIVTVPLSYLIMRAVERSKKDDDESDNLSEGGRDQPSSSGS